MIFVSLEEKVFIYVQLIGCPVDVIAEIRFSR